MDEILISSPPFAGGKEKRMHVVLKLGIVIFMLYLTYAATLFLSQRRIMFPRHMVPGPPETFRPGKMEVIWLDMDFGKVEAWYLPPEPVNSSSDPAGLNIQKETDSLNKTDNAESVRRAAGKYPGMIFTHGNGELIDYWPIELVKFSQLGIGVLLVEYPGYGRSEGEPSQKTITKTLEKAYDWLALKQEIDSGNIIFFGSSIGGGAVCSLAKTRQASALILMSTFTSSGKLASRYMVPGFLLLDAFDNLSVVKNFEGPVVVIHGKHDTIIPYSHGQKLADAAKNGRFFSYDCGHNDCPPDWNGFLEKLLIFFQKEEILHLDRHEAVIENPLPVQIP